MNQLKCFLSSPYASNLISKEVAVWDALGALSVLRHLRPVIHVDEVAASDRCVWSPLIQGQVILWNTGRRWPWKVAMEWCLWCLEHGGFTDLIVATSPRKPGYGRNGMDVEADLARKLGYRIMPQSEAERLEFFTTPQAQV